MKKIALLLALLVQFLSWSVVSAATITITTNPTPTPLAVPEGGARLNFVSLSVTSAQPAVVRTIVIPRSGNAPPGAIKDVVILDEFERRVGDVGFFNGGSQATITLNLVVLPGHSYKLVVAGEFERNLSAWHNLTVSLGVSQITGSIGVSGPFPISGTTHTIDSITVGSFQVTPLSPLANEVTAIGPADQLLGQFRVDVTGESVIVGGPEFDIYAWTQSPLGLNDVKLFDESGNLLAGPIGVDETANPFQSSAVFYELFTLNQGTHVITMRGTLDGTAFPGDMITVSALPQNWHVIRGATYGYELARQYEAVVSDPVSVFGPSLIIRLFDTNLPPRTVIAGARQVEIGQYVLDATDSSEDLRVAEVPTYLVTSGFSPNNLTSCAFYDGGVAIPGSVLQISPFGATQGVVMFRFNPPLLVRRGQVKVLSLRCDVSSSSASGGSFSSGIIDTGTNVNGTCVFSDLPITTHYIPARGQIITVVTSGRLSLLPSAFTPRRVQIGVTNATMVEFNALARDEGISGSGARIEIPITLTPWTNGSPVSLQNISTLRLVNSAGVELASASSITATPSGDRLHGMLTFQCNQNCRFDNGVVTPLRIKGTLSMAFYTGDQLSFDIDAARFTSFRGESSFATVIVDGHFTVVVIAQCAVAQLDVIQVTSARLAGQNDLIELGFFVAENRLYHIETSTDMVNWIRVTPFPLENSSGYIRYFFEVVPGATQRFFRAVAVQ